MHHLAPISGLSSSGHQFRQGGKLSQSRQVPAPRLQGLALEPKDLILVLGLALVPGQCSQSSLSFHLPFGKMGIVINTPLEIIDANVL